MSHLSAAEVERRMPTLRLIDHTSAIRQATAEFTMRAPDYFWEVPAASTAKYHHPACCGEGGLWAHTLMLSTVIERLGDSYVGRGLLEEGDIDLAHAAAILHDQRKRGDPANPADRATRDHDLEMAEYVRESAIRIDDRVADAIASHMGPWYEGPQPETPLQDLVHTADMIASTKSITPAVQGPIPEELDHCGLEAVDFR